MKYVMQCAALKLALKAQASGGIPKKVLTELPWHSDMIVRSEYWDDSAYGGNGKLFVKDMVYTKAGHFVGDKKFASYLAAQNIRPILADPAHSVCSIGFSTRLQKWFGWSHRAICGFSINGTDRIFEEDYGDDNTLYVEHGPKLIQTLDDAKQAAINFADYVS